MSQRRSRIRHLRAPFVITVSVGAGVAGCGGSVSGGEHGGSGGETSENPPACQREECGSGGTGGFDGSGGVPSTGGTVSTGGQPQTMCPDSPPESGGDCALPEDAQCEFGSDPCFGEPETIASCDGGSWVVEHLVSSCNPPPPPSEVCPAVEPRSGDYCNVVPDRVCSYGDCYGVPTAEARCVDEMWAVLTTECNPPPPSIDSGPGFPSRDGGPAVVDGGVQYDAGIADSGG